MAKPKDDTVPSNPLLVQWPTDLDGITSDLKAGILSAAGRLNGRQEKLDIFLATVKVGVAHVMARFDAQIAENAESVRWRKQQEEARAKLSPTKGWQPR